MTTTSEQIHGEAFMELVRLQQLEEEARERVTHAGHAARAAAAELAQAREALTEAERTGAAAAERKRLESRLAAAQQRHGEPWAERRAGAERAARDAHHAVARHAADHLDELVVEFEEDGRAAAEQVNAAGEAFVEAVARRQQVERELTAVVALTRRMRPGDIARSRSEEAARQVRSLLQRGGEQPPELRIERPAVEAST